MTAPRIAGYIVEFKRGTGPWKRADWMGPWFCADDDLPEDTLRYARSQRDYAAQNYRSQRFRLRALLAGKVTR